MCVPAQPRNFTENILGNFLHNLLVVTFFSVMLLLDASAINGWILSSIAMEEVDGAVAVGVVTKST